MRIDKGLTSLQNQYARRYRLKRGGSKYGYVYALVDPFLHEIRYVGQSYTPELRWYSHASEKAGNPGLRSWLHSLRDHGCVPELVILQKCRWWENPYHCEQEWIGRMLEAGQPLLNRSIYQAPSFWTRLKAWFATPKDVKRAQADGKIRG